MNLSILRKPFKYQCFNAVYWIIGINVLVFIAMRFLGHIYVTTIDITVARSGLVERPLSLEHTLAMMPLAVIRNGAVWSFVTYMFMHGGFTHLLFNMLGLFIFGTHIERQMGSREFLLYYFVTGIMAGFFSFLVYIATGQLMVALVGASGALFAVMLAYAVFFPSAIIYIWGILPLRAPVMVLGYTALSMFFVITGGGGNVAHMTHLAGFGFGWLYFMIRFGANPWRRLTGR